MAIKYPQFDSLQFDQNLTWYVHSAEWIPFNLFSIDYKRHFSVYFPKFHQFWNNLKINELTNNWHIGGIERDDIVVFKSFGKKP